MASPPSNEESQQQQQQQPPLPAEAPAVTLGVVSQNLWSTYFSVVGRDRYGRMRGFAEYLARFPKKTDVVMLQEVYVASLLGGAIVLGEDTMEMLQIGLEQKCGLKYFVRSQPGGCSLSGTSTKVREPQPLSWGSSLLLHQNGGLVIASRYPIVSSRFVPFTSASLHESFNWKGMLQAKIDVNGTMVSFMTVHLDAGMAQGPRSQQYYQIRKQLAEDRADPPHIIAGDFNTCARTYGARGALQYNEMRTCMPGYDSVFDISVPTHRDTKGGGREGMTLDYIFLDGSRGVHATERGLLDFRCVTDSTLPVSDHFGLYAQITIPGRTATTANHDNNSNTDGNNNNKKSSNT